MPVQYSDDFMPNVAHGYSDNGLFPDEPKDITRTNNSWASTAGAMVANSHDIATWFYHLVHGTLLESEQMDELMTTTDGTLPDNKKISYGLGIMHDFKTFGEEAWWHSGSTLGYSSMMIWLKDRDIIITANVNHITADKSIYALTQNIVALLQKQDSGDQIE